MKKIIIDTDIGTDIDDAMAITLAVVSDEVNICGITTVYGDTEYRGQLAKKLVKLCDANIPVYCGVNKPLLRKRSIFMAGNEGVESQSRLNETIEQMHAVDYIIKTILENPGQISIVAIGPLTNIALAIIKEPRIIDQIDELIIMGGVTRLGSNSLDCKLWTEEHNIVCDPEAADVVLNSGANIYLIGLDVTMRLDISTHERDLLLASNTKINTFLANMLDDWMKFVKEYFNEEQTFMHDPLALACSFNKSFVKFVPMDIEVIYNDKERSGMTIGKLNELSNIKVALEVDRDGFIEFLLSRLLKKTEESYEK